MRYPNRTIAVLAAGAVLTCSAAVAGEASAQEKQMTVAMITHAQPGDTFWDIIRKGAEAAAKKDNIKLIYLADPTATKQAQLISNVVEQHVDGIALTLAFPDAEASAVKAAQRAGIPIVGFNAGVDQWKSQGLLGYAGQDETVAGKAVGEELNKEGAKNVVCLDQQQGAVQLGGDRPYRERQDSMGGRPATVCRGLRGGRHAVALRHQRGYPRWRWPGADRPLLCDQGQCRRRGQIRQGRHALSRGMAAA